MALEALESPVHREKKMHNSMEEAIRSYAIMRYDDAVARLEMLQEEVLRAYETIERVKKDNKEKYGIEDSEYEKR